MQLESLRVHPEKKVRILQKIAKHGKGERKIGWDEEKNRRYATAFRVDRFSMRGPRVGAQETDLRANPGLIYATPFGVGFRTECLHAATDS